MVLLSSNVCAQDSLKLKTGQNPFTASNTEPVTIRIRCNATNPNTKPLIIIDGIAAETRDLRNIDPNDIENITILKDLTATALYGYRAGNGVIIIKTKTAVDSIKVISNDQISIQERQKVDNLKLYPNPVLRSQKINIEIRNKKDNKLTVKLFNLIGKLVGSSEYQMKQGLNKISYLPKENLTAGIYILQIIDEKNRLLKADKLIIQ